MRSIPIPVLPLLVAVALSGCPNIDRRGHRGGDGPESDDDDAWSTVDDDDAWPSDDDDSWPSDDDDAEQSDRATLQVEPLEHDFGRVAPGCEAEVQVSLRNVGDGPLEVSSLAYEGTDEQLTAQLPELPLVLEAGGEELIPIRLLAAELGSVGGVLGITSSDPQGPDQASQLGEVDWAAWNTEVFTIPEDVPVDVLFAVDRSFSMQTEAQELGVAFADFVASVAAVTSDWQVGVAIHDDGCLNGGILSPWVPYYQQVFLDSVTELGGPTMTEQMLAIATAALQQSAPGGCNEGFRRAGAPLHLVTVSDEQEQSGVPWFQWVAELEALAGDPDLLTISAVVDIDAVCGDGTGSGGYAEAAEATGGVVLDICTASWADAVLELAAASVEGIADLPLAMPPVPETVEVLVDSQPSAGWLLSDDGTSLGWLVPPPGGSEVTVTYAVAEECPGL